MKPILFNTQMVRAILDGRKTVTRRLIKPQPQSPVAFEQGQWCETVSCANGIRVLVPPFEPGDVLYVRETWAMTGELPGISEEGIVYMADLTATEIQYTKDRHFRWRPSIHMPKAAARIFLKVVSVRTERLQDMVLADVLMEGIAEGDSYADTWKRWRDLWDSTIDPADLPVYGWEANPWTWVIRFEQCEKRQEVQQDGDKNPGDT